MTARANGRQRQAARRERARQERRVEPVLPPGRPVAHASRLAARWHAIRVVQRRDFFSLLFAPGIYAAIALGMLGALVVVRGHLDAIAANRVLILSDAFTLPFFVATTIGMLFLALVSVATVAREREAGTLEALFYGPVDHASYLLAKHAAQVAGFAVMSLSSAALLLAYAGLSGLRLGIEVVPEVLLSIVAAAAVAAAGLFFSTLTRSARAALALFFGTSVLLLAIHFGGEIAAGIAVTNNFSPLLFARNLAIGLAAVVAYASPFAVFQNGVDAVVRGAVLEYLGALALAAIQCLVLLAASVRLLERRGVRR